MLNIGYVGVFYDIAHCSLVAETTTTDFPTSVYEPNFFVKTIHTIITFYIPDFKKEKIWQYNLKNIFGLNHRPRVFEPMFAHYWEHIASF